MNTIWSFGDSFSTPFDENPFKVSEDYINYKGYCPKVFSQIVAKNLNYNCVINASGGLDNYSILENVSNISDKVKDGDIIIIGWSHINRFRIVKKNGDWLSILPFLRLDKFLEFNMNTLDVFAVNRHDNEQKYTDEVNSWIKLINKAFEKNLVFHWSAFLKTKINAMTFKTISTITKETNGVIEDGHYGEIGHKELSDVFLSMISKNKNNYLI